MPHRVGPTFGVTPAGRLESIALSVAQMFVVHPLKIVVHVMQHGYSSKKYGTKLMKLSKG